MLAGLIRWQERWKALKETRELLEKAVVLQPRNPFAVRTLGQLLLMKDDAPGALPQLRSAASVAPDDPINLFTESG